jgi:hypothetical protein
MAFSGMSSLNPFPVSEFILALDLNHNKLDNFNQTGWGNCQNSQ